MSSFRRVREDLRLEVLAYMLARPAQPHSNPSLALHLQLPCTWIASITAHLLHAGQIVRLEAGLYALSDRMLEPLDATPRPRPRRRATRRRCRPSSDRATAAPIGIQRALPPCGAGYAPAAVREVVLAWMCAVLLEGPALYTALWQASGLPRILFDQILCRAKARDLVVAQRISDRTCYRLSGPDLPCMRAILTPQALRVLSLLDGAPGTELSLVRATGWARADVRVALGHLWACGRLSWSTRGALTIYRAPDDHALAQAAD